MADDVVWGTGYGSTRHLVEPGTRKDEGEAPKRVYGRDRYATAQCSSTVFLSFFSDKEGEYDGEQVLKKKMCTRCAKKAGEKTCPTCNGAGSVLA